MPMTAGSCSRRRRLPCRPPLDLLVRVGSRRSIASGGGHARRNVCRPSNKDGRPTRCRDDPPLQEPVLSLASARRRRGGRQPVRHRRRDRDSGGPARHRRSVLHAGLHRRLRSRVGDASDARGVPARLRCRRHRFPAGRRARLDLHPARARLARFHRARGSRCASRAPRHPRRVATCAPPRGRGLRARARVSGDARDRLLRQPQRAALPPARAGGQHAADSVLPCRPRALPAPLPRLGTPVFRPGSPVRVGLPTTKEARCPSTSCSRV